MRQGIASVEQIEGYREFEEIIDVRTPAEFADDHIPGSINCPVLDNAQRVEVGTLYKQVSPFAAKKIGAAYVAENIARLQPKADSAKIVEAAQKAAAHDMILRLPDGYDTRVSTLGGRLSGGQIQRIGLARALYDNPVLLVLDEPNSNLDNEGSQALNLAIRNIKARGGAVIIMAHRPAAIQECDMLLVMNEGAVAAFGPRDAVLRETVRNATEIVRSSAPGGVA